MINFCHLFRIVSRNSKHGDFCYIQIYGNYRFKIGSKFLRKIRFDSNYNQIFDYAHGTHCLTLITLDQEFLTFFDQCTSKSRKKFHRPLKCQQALLVDPWITVKEVYMCTNFTIVTFEDYEYGPPDKNLWTRYFRTQYCDKKIRIKLLIQYFFCVNCLRHFCSTDVDGNIHFV
jgi:hypothetical protein